MTLIKLQADYISITVQKIYVIVHCFSFCSLIDLVKNLPEPIQVKKAQTVLTARIFFFSRMAQQGNGQTTVACKTEAHSFKENLSMTQ